MTVARSRRREFLGFSAAAFVAAHARVVAGLGHPAAPSRPPLISEIELLSGVDLAELKAFYSGLLGLTASHDSAERLTLQAGSTSLTFVPGSGADTRPFYHFAFNIPENKILDALGWQQKRSPLLPIPPRNRAAGYPDNVVDYSHWNAHSVFFLDPAGNVVEYIARHDLANAAPGPFSARDILYASEIAFIVDDVRSGARAVRDVGALAQYRGGDDNFMAIGDEHGLLLVMKRGRILNFDPSTTEKAARIFQTRVTVRGTRATDFQWPGSPYAIRVV
jgi:catechol 2,3-dioxygenase-like lactoylglutathione lyase family enzyme